MSYTITTTAGTALATVADGTVNTTTTSLTLIGKNYAGYGIFLNENYVKLLENFASGAAPTNPLTGQLWYDSGTNTLKLWNTALGLWKAISSSISQATPPATNVSVTGDLWWDTTNVQLKVFSGSAWITIGPAYTSTSGTSGAVVETILDSTSNSHVVVKFYISNAVIAILSTGSAFTPQTSISGFTTIRPGLNLISSSTLPGSQFSGDVSNALTLQGVSASQFLRSDQNTSTNYQLTVGGGLIVGSDLQVNTTSATEVQLYNVTTNKDLNLYVTKSVGGQTKAIGINGSTAAVTLAGALNVTGASILSSTLNVTGATTLGSTLGVTGATTLSSTLGVTGAATLYSTLNVSGTTTLASLSATTASFSGGISVANLITSSSGISGGPATHTTGSFSSTLGVTGATTLAGLTANAASFSGTVAITGATTLSSTLSVSGLITSTSGISGGPANHTTGVFSSTLGAGNTTVSGTLNVSSATTLSSTLNVSSTSTLAGVTATGLTMSGKILPTSTAASIDIGSSSQNFGNLFLSGNVTATKFIGDGTGLTGVVAGSVSASSLTGTTLATGVVTSSLTSVGTLSSLSVSGSITVNSANNATAIINGGTSGGGNIGSSTTPFNTVYAKSTTAQYADLAERFAADAPMLPGTVVEIGGIKEITKVIQELSEAVFGVISTKAAFLMNGSAGEDATHPPVAMQGRVPVRVTGTIKKGDRLVSAGNGLARAALRSEITAFNVIGRALEDKTTADEGTVEAIVKINS